MRSCLAVLFVFLLAVPTAAAYAAAGAAPAAPVCVTLSKDDRDPVERVHGVRPAAACFGAALGLVDDVSVGACPEPVCVLAPVPTPGGAQSAPGVPTRLVTFALLA